MASEESGESTLSITVSEELQDWLDDAADRRDVDPDVLVRQLIAAHRAIEGDNGTSGDAVELFDPAVTEGQLERETDDLRAEFMELIEDVRKRVIQVKRETDAKASKDHGHEELERIKELHTTVRQLETAVDGLDSTLSDVESDLEAGFDNYEEILEYVLDTLDDLETRTTTLARATIQARERLHEVAAAHGKRSAVDELKLAASQYGIESAACDGCGTSVRLALLTAPECPHCAASFEEVRPKSSLFGRPTLATGEPPALTGSSMSKLDRDLEAQIGPESEEQTVDPDDVDWKPQNDEGSGDES